jgi:hypothetical protein
LIRKVTADATDGAGISLLQGYRNVVADSHVGGWDALYVSGTRATVTGNTLAAWRGTSLFMYAAGSMVRSNIIPNDGDGEAVVLAAPDVTFVANFVSNWRLTTGTLVSPSATRAVIARNRFVNNFGDGLPVEAPGTLVRDNVANDNGGWGIYAVDGVIDGGRNVASGNGEPAQCFNIICR